MSNRRFTDAARSQMQQSDSFLGVSMASWVVSENTVCYERKDAHTLSIYRSGGERSYRTDIPSKKGGPGKLCTMPQGLKFDWTIKDTIEFTHLYLPQSLLSWFISKTFEQDVREAEFPSLLYEEDKTLKLKILKCFYVLRNYDDKMILLEEIISDILYLLYTKKHRFRETNKIAPGGLSPFHRNLVREHIHANYGNKLTISRMASLTKLSHFHFAKMFKLSFGLTPSAFVTKVRVGETKKLLKEDCSLAHISHKVGFSHQSHMTQTFRILTGFTPSQYRKQINTKLVFLS